MMAEIVGMMDGILEAGATRQFTRWPVQVECDNQSSIRVVERGYSAAITEYTHALKLRISSVKDLIELEQIEVKYVPTKANVSDLFTKLFARGELERLSRLIGMRSPDRSGVITDSTGDMECLTEEERNRSRQEAADAKRSYIREAKGGACGTLPQSGFE